MRSAAFASSVAAYPAGSGGSSSGTSVQKERAPVSISAPFVAASASRPRSAHPHRDASRSGATSPARSLLVVSSGSTPSSPASRSVNVRPPPRCAPVTGSTVFPSSVTTSTAGSSALSERCGATARTAMPSDATKTSASARLHQEATVAARAPDSTRTTVPASSRRRAVASPFDEKQKNAVFIAEPRRSLRTKRAFVLRPTVRERRPARRGRSAASRAGFVRRATRRTLRRRSARGG